MEVASVFLLCHIISVLFATELKAKTAIFNFVS